VQLVVNSNEVCADTASTLVTVYPNPVPDFDAGIICVNLPFVPNNRTNDQIGSPVRYTWKYDGQLVAQQRIPPAQLFTGPGRRSITLEVSSDQCPSPVQTLTKTLLIEAEMPSRRYTTAFAVSGIPLPLEARPIGLSALWQPARQLNDPTSYKPVFAGTQQVDYTVTLTTEGGCKTVDSLLVQIVKQADIEVPSAFTPNDDGLNDRLRPVAIGVAEIRYFRVFNRWGQVMYEAHSALPGWDGKYNGVPQTAQTFVWMVQGVGIDGTIITKKGTSVLIR
jgi:gliding motility-associated-like protein